ncbi:hypothetical protein E2C01_013432 [Portunus trituberculatus]|uniref:Uncharacterized protein n=1 Tax=Portunus trituberculatus TaxID=210409 RepID=A0A5B7DH31_PORTR|nr:hypothetical protein [Portunus trituberculatus]
MRTKGLLLIINHKFISSKSGLTTSTTTNKRFGTSPFIESGAARLHQCPTFRKRFLVLAGSTATLCISATPLVPCPCVVPGALLLLPTSSTH